MTIENMLAGILGDCKHDWIANSGRGGEPEYRPNRQMSHEPLMHVMCAKCKARTWFTERQWRDK